MNIPNKVDPWEGFTGQSDADAADAELIDPILKALGESRARFGDMEQRALAAEAVTEEVAARTWDEGWRAACEFTYKKSLYRQSLMHGPEIEPPPTVVNPYRSGSEGETR